jgi:hypothetical protein
MRRLHLLGGLCACFFAAAVGIGAVAAQRTARPSPDAETIRPGQARPRMPVEVNSIADVFMALKSCWTWPPDRDARPDMQLTVLVTYRRNGERFGKPRVTYETRDATPAQQATYYPAAADMLVRCNKLPFTESLGNAVAGRPFRLRFHDNRHQKKV